MNSLGEITDCRFLESEVGRLHGYVWAVCMPIALAPPLGEVKAKVTCIDELVGGGVGAADAACPGGAHADQAGARAARSVAHAHRGSLRPWHRIETVRRPTCRALTPRCPSRRS